MPGRRYGHTNVRTIQGLFRSGKDVQDGREINLLAGEGGIEGVSDVARTHAFVLRRNGSTYLKVMCDTSDQADVEHE